MRVRGWGEGSVPLASVASAISLESSEYSTTSGCRVRVGVVRLRVRVVRVSGQGQG